MGQICVHGAPKNDDCVGYDYRRDAAFQWFENELFEALRRLWFLCVYGGWGLGVGTCVVCMLVCMGERD